MNLIKGRMTSIGVAAAVLALVAVQALAFSQTTQTKDSLQPTGPASIVPAKEDATAEATPPVQPATKSSSPKPAITGVSADDDDELDDEYEVEDDD